MNKRMTYKELRKSGMINGNEILLLPQNKETFEYGQGLWDMGITEDGDYNATSSNETDRYEFLASLPIKKIESGANLSTSMNENEDDDDYYDEEYTEGHQFYDLSAYDLVITVLLTPNEFKDFELKEDNE